MKKNNDKKIVENNSDFLFVYEAIQCNPNGDPDQENKPRMDYDTKTNLVTDTRIKRYIRDYLRNINIDIFVDMEENRKVTPEDKLKIIVKRIIESDKKLSEIFKSKPNYFEIINNIISEEKDIDKVLNKITNKQFGNKEVNYFLLEYLVKEMFIDVRMFGSAFAVPGFTKAFTGPVQLNWGFSLNKVELMESNSIVTIMADDSSTFGKDYRLYYSLLAFNGTINKFAAVSTGLSNKDLGTFRDSIWNSITSLPTRSKLNQYPKLYLEIIYNDGFNNGHFGDLRNYIKSEPIEKLEEKQIRKFKDLIFDFKNLKNLIKNNKGEGKPIKEIIIKTSSDINF